jgi:predicted HicB family RNase H-like nuclease
MLSKQKSAREDSKDVLTARQHERIVDLLAREASKEMAKNNEQIIRTTIRVPQRLWDLARHTAIDEKMSLQDLVIKALVKYVENAGKGTRR